MVTDIYRRLFCTPEVMWILAYLHICINVDVINALWNMDVRLKSSGLCYDLPGVKKVMGCPFKM